MAWTVGGLKRSPDEDVACGSLDLYRERVTRCGRPQSDGSHGISGSGLRENAVAAEKTGLALSGKPAASSWDRALAEMMAAHARAVGEEAVALAVALALALADDVVFVG